MRNTVKIIESYRGKINPRYDLGHIDIQAIYKNSESTFNMVCNAFMFGYAQGVKATKSELSERK